MLCIKSSSACAAISTIALFCYAVDCNIMISSADVDNGFADFLSSDDFLFGPNKVGPNSDKTWLRNCKLTLSNLRLVDLRYL